MTIASNRCLMSIGVGRNQSYLTRQGHVLCELGLIHTRLDYLSRSLD